MPTYHYKCNGDCKSDSPVPDGTAIVITKSGSLIWEVRHGMTETPEIKCPSCSGVASRTLEGIGFPIHFIKGNCYLNREECRRQMDIHKLESGDDPYGHMRQPGEVDQIKQDLKNHNKPKRKYLS